MRWTKTLIPTLKEAPQEAESASHRLMLRAGMVRMLMSGVYSYLPLGLRVLHNIENIIRQEMAAANAEELLLPALQPEELWIKTQRDKLIGDVMIRFTDRKNRKICLGPTHEEVITDLVKDNVNSYRQLPLVLYQIQTKFRDEIRPRFGVVRACEFIMKDAYSFDRDEAGLDKNYQLMLTAYNNIFRRCGLNFLAIEADSGVMGGNVSHEFMVPAESGEDMVLKCGSCGFAKGFKGEDDKHICPKCKSELKKVNTIEIGHIFKLGTKYSKSLEANFLDEQGKLNPIVMGCYGIGVSRLIAAIIEQNHDQDGIIWPKEVSPYQAILIPIDTTDDKIRAAAEWLYRELITNNISVLLDDRSDRAGVKFKDADLIGVGLKIIIGREFLENGNIELKLRLAKDKMLAKENEILAKIKQVLNV